MRKLNVRNLLALSSNHFGCHLPEAPYKTFMQLIRPSKAGGRNSNFAWLGSTLTTVAVGLFLSMKIVYAAEYDRFPGKDLRGHDIGGSIDALGIAVFPDVQNFCQRACDDNNRCMAFTAVRPGGFQGDVGKCWLKASVAIFEMGSGLLTTPRSPDGGDLSGDVFTGVKKFVGRPTGCWARHIFNLKFCNVFLVDTIRENDPSFHNASNAFQCPPESSTAFISHNVATPGAANKFCVIRLANDPGGLPNCTDAFGGESHEADVLGNGVNQACLDAN